MNPVVVALIVAIVLSCLQALWPAAGLAADFPRPQKLAIASLMNIGAMQFGAAQEKGWFVELGVPSMELLRFTSGAPMLQAIAAGQVDIAYIGVGPLLVAGHRGLPFKAVA